MLDRRTSVVLDGVEVSRVGKKLWSVPKAENIIRWYERWVDEVKGSTSYTGSNE